MRMPMRVDYTHHTFCRPGYERWLHEGELLYVATLARGLSVADIRRDLHDSLTASAPSLLEESAGMEAIKAEIDAFVDRFSTAIESELRHLESVADDADEEEDDADLLGDAHWYNLYLYLEVSQDEEGMEDLLQPIIDRIKAAVESDVDYRTTHKDEGNNVLELVSECIQDDDIRSQLAEMVADDDIPAIGMIDFDELVRRCIDAAEAESISIYNGYSYGLELATFPIGEIETIIDDMEILPDWAQAYVRQYSDATLRFQSDGIVYAYTTTDLMWRCYVSTPKLAEIINDMLAELES